MKLIIYILLGISPLKISGQTERQGIKILIEEKTKDGKKPVLNEPIKVVINDTVAYDLSTNGEGHVLIMNRPAGPCKIKLLRVGCLAMEYKNIIIGEGKTAYITFNLTCASYINTLTKKEKKKLGYQ